MPRTYLLTALLSFAALAAGCSGDDPVSTPANNTLQLDAVAAEEWTTSALEMVNGVAVALPDFADGDYSTWNPGMVNKSAEEPTWDGDQMAYVYDFTGPVMELQDPNYWLASISLWIQYRAGSSPVQYPVGADEMEVDVAVGMDMHMEEEGSTADLDYDYVTNLVVSDLGGGGSYGVVGSGSTVVDVANVTPEANEQGNFSMSWSLDMNVSPDGCPSGTATVQTQVWTLEAVYDGAGNVDWTLTGPGYLGSGSETLACQPPM